MVNEGGKMNLLNGSGASLVEYQLSDDEEEDAKDDGSLLPTVSEGTRSLLTTECSSAPDVDEPMENRHRLENRLQLMKKGSDDLGSSSKRDDEKEVALVNLRYEEMFAATVGAENPFVSEQQRAVRNTISGFLEPAHLSHYHFDQQRTKFANTGVAVDPSVYDVKPATEDDVDAIVAVAAAASDASNKLVVRRHFDDSESNGEIETIQKMNDEGTNNLTEVVAEENKKQVEDENESEEGEAEKKKKEEFANIDLNKKDEKRKRIKRNDPSDVDGYLGPWAGFVDEKRNVKPSQEEAAELEEYLAKKRRKNSRKKGGAGGAQGHANDAADQAALEDEKSVLHINDPLDYQGRSFMVCRRGDGEVRLKGAPPKCFLPKAHIHTWRGHTKALTAIRWFPNTAHLLLSSSMDARVKLWEVYKERRCIRTYYGHKEAVRDICFNREGDRFLSAGYDRWVKLWDTESGECLRRFTNRKVAYCVKFNPDADKQHLFVAGTSDKKIICWDTRTGELVQEYDRHLGAVNSITFVDENRRFVTTSDDKSLRVWEWDIPVDMKYIADPSMHSMPSVRLSPNGKWLACQSMDNKIVIFSAFNRFKLNRNKTFHGHMVAGYACSLDYSPDMSYLCSGDGDGKCYVWDWKSSKLLKKWKAHDGVCIDVLWHPHETSKIATAGWDGLIKYWD